jgi:hypothetical protein
VCSFPAVFEDEGYTKDFSPERLFVSLIFLEESAIMEKRFFSPSPRRHGSSDIPGRGTSSLQKEGTYPWVP